LSTPCQFDAAYYEKIYRHYELQNPPRKLRFYRRIVESYRPGGRILDIGCAFGKFLSSLGSSWDRFGVDLSEHAITSCGAESPDVTLAVASASEIPFAGPFDAITSFDVLEHVPDLEPVYAYVSRNLAPDGVFLFVVPVYDGPLGPLVHLLDKDPTHVHKKAREFWLKWARERFEVVEWWGVFRYLTPGAQYYVHWPTKLLRSVAPAIALLVRSR
jgi:SAM-dependent methyltransferase